MTDVQLGALANAAAENAQIFLPYMNEVLSKYNIQTPEQQLCFLAQVCHESGGLFYTEELASGSAYEGRKDLGNAMPGDGERFKGRGLIQITGRNNYKEAGAALGVHLINNPTLLGGKNVNECTTHPL